jgi:hypothetical protein
LKSQYYPVKETNHDLRRDLFYWQDKYLNLYALVFTNVRMHLAHITLRTFRPSSITVIV